MTGQKSIENGKSKIKKVVGLATHNTGNAYGCSVPRLTRFTPGVCMGPDHKEMFSGLECNGALYHRYINFREKFRKYSIRAISPLAIIATAVNKNEYTK